MLVHYGNGDFDKALLFIQKAINKDSKNREYYNQMIDWTVSEGKIDSALSMCTSAILTFRHDAGAFLLMGQEIASQKYGSKTKHFISLLRDKGILTEEQYKLYSSQLSR